VVIKRGLKGVIHSSEVWSYWKIIAPDGYHIELRFTDFDVDRVYMDKVGNFPVCLFGQVLVYPDDSSECKQYCGTLGYRKRVLSKTNVMIVEFYDYSADSFGGYGFFRAMYQARPPSCGDPGTPSNGTKIGETYTFPNLVRYSCNAGFHLVGSSARKCQINGSWSGSPATCQRDRCGDPGVPLQGIIASFTSNKDEVTLQCQTLYERVGGYHNYRRCLENGTWSGRPFICRPICGLRSSRIYDEFEGDVRGSHPWRAMLYLNPCSDSTQCTFCGGVILNSKYVLTTASCLFQNRSFVIRLGSHNATNNVTDELWCTSEKIILHPKFDEKRSPTTLHSFRSRNVFLWIVR
jgi:hypothetical protein